MYACTGRHKKIGKTASKKENRACTRTKDISKKKEKILQNKCDTQGEQCGHRGSMARCSHGELGCGGGEAEAC